MTWVAQGGRLGGDVWMVGGEREWVGGIGNVIGSENGTGIGHKMKMGWDR